MIGCYIDIWAIILFGHFSVILNYFKNIITEEEFKNAISNINGIFSVIIQKEKNIMLAVDKTRTFPLFYLNNENELIISYDTY